jgi:hypothetical protein
MTALRLVTTTAPASRTDTRLLKVCRQYLALMAHIQTLRDKRDRAQALAAAVLHDPPTDHDAAALWSRLWQTTPACFLARGVEDNERRLDGLLTEIVQTPARTEAGIRARLQVWRTVLSADDADLLLDSLMADIRRRRA